LSEVLTRNLTCKKREGGWGVVSLGYMNLWVDLQVFGLGVSLDIFFSRLLTRIFRSTSSFCSSATVGLGIFPHPFNFGQLYNKIADINKICAIKNVITEQMTKKTIFS
jgi:hypothetical protein